MKTTRFLKARTLGYVCAAMLAFGASPLFAQQQESSGSIYFAEKDGFKSENAAQILNDRLHLRAGTDELRAAYDEHPGNGLEVQRFNQYFKGVRVAHGTYTLTSKNGLASFALGKFYDIDPGTGIVPQLSEADALDKALKATSAARYMWQADPSASASKGVLQFVEDFSHGEPDGTVRLAYAFDIYAIEPLSRNMVYVDAQSGKILFTDAILKHVTASAASLYSGTLSFEAQLSGSTYKLADLTRGAGIFTYNLGNTTPSGGGGNGTYSEVTSATTTFSTDPAIDAHWGAERVYDYWKNVRNRNSWNGSNAVMKSYVHYGTNYNNAFWDGGAMNYGDGSGPASGGFSPLTSLDVCGHEMGHGVCQSTAGLVYAGESGGMNEGFSDIWGAVIETFGNPHEVDAVPKSTWIIGEELGNALRSMSDPNLYRQPDTYLGRYWIYTGAGCDQPNDHCGVHTNSGVLNYWFYLISVGGKGVNDLGNSYQVAPIGMTAAAEIVYATELALYNTANYNACRTASINAATTLYGACSKEVEAITRAWYAVGVGSNFAACTPQLSFASPAFNVDEAAGANGCIPGRTVTIPLTLNGPAPTGGNAVVTVTAVGGTAVAGVDYALLSSTATFPAGSTSAQTVSLTVYDNGYLGANKYVDLAMSVNASGSNAVAALVMDTVRVTISSDDHAPLSGATEIRTIGNNAFTADSSSPFQSAYVSSRSQFIYTAQELATAGLRAGMPISAAHFNVVKKNSTQPFNGYTMKIGQTNQTSFTSTFASPTFATVYSAGLSTTPGWNVIPFSTPYTWDGLSNIIVEICFSNSSASADNDFVASSTGGSSAALAYSNSSGGCSLPLSSGGVSYHRPQIRFVQVVAPTAVDVTVNDSRVWNAKSAQTTYFYAHPAQSIIAGIGQPTADLGCVTAQLTAQGKGFTSFTPGQGRSIRQVAIQPAAPVSGNPSFDAIIYFRNDDLNGVDAYSVSMVQTSAATDAAITTANTTVVPPAGVTVIEGEDWTGFKASFTDFGRFFLSGDALVVAVGNTPAAANDLWTGANPFVTAPVLHWNLAKSERVSIRVTDITGKVIYSTDRMLEAGANKTELSLNADVAPGAYVLQVVRPGGVFTRQLIKQ